MNLKQGQEVRDAADPSRIGIVVGTGSSLGARVLWCWDESLTWTSERPVILPRWSAPGGRWKAGHVEDVFTDRDEAIRAALVYELPDYGRVEDCVAVWPVDISGWPTGPATILAVRAKYELTFETVAGEDLFEEEAVAYRNADLPHDLVDLATAAKSVRRSVATMRRWIRIRLLTSYPGSVPVHGGSPLSMVSLTRARETAAWLHPEGSTNV